MEKNKILSLGMVLVLSLSLSACHVQRQTDRRNQIVENNDLHDRTNNGTSEIYTEEGSGIADTESSTISEFQETHQDLIDEIEYEIIRAEERLVIQMEEYVAGVWESVQDSDETIEIINGSFIRTINGEIVEEGYLYTYINLGYYEYFYEFETYMHFGLIGELRSAIVSEYDILLSRVLENAKELNLENFTRLAGELAFIIMDYKDQTFDISEIDHITDMSVIELRFSTTEILGISVNSQAFRKPR